MILVLVRGMAKLSIAGGFEQQAASATMAQLWEARVAELATAMAWHDRAVAFRKAVAAIDDDTQLLELDAMHLLHGLQVAAVSGLGHCERPRILSDDESEENADLFERNQLAKNYRGDEKPSRKLGGTLKGLGA